MVNYTVQDLLTDKPHMGLVDRIRQAKTEQEVTNLLAEGTKYTLVSTKTARKWGNVAKRRVAQLRSPKREPATNQATNRK
jgi:hypothetical protein